MTTLSEEEQAIVDTVGEFVDRAVHPVTRESREVAASTVCHPQAPSAHLARDGGGANP
ncbi:MAG TPA: hypothetical protein VHX38_17630 [Pseudonocardiaceae bacterium]|nr:hypothetical protein [Pseudonocardiaceae bacterium]